MAAKAALEKQAEDVVVMDLRTLSTVTDFFVVCTALSRRQASALKEYIESSLMHQGCAMWHTEGVESLVLPTENSGDASEKWEDPLRVANPNLLWVLMDCGDIVIHIQDPAARTCYQLERLWADAPRVPIDFAKQNLSTKQYKVEGVEGERNP